MTLNLTQLGIFFRNVISFSKFGDCECYIFYAIYPKHYIISIVDSDGLYLAPGQH